MSVKAGVRVVGSCLLVLLAAAQAHAVYSYSEVVAALQEWSARPASEEHAQLRVVRIGSTVKGRAILMAVIGGSAAAPLDSGDAVEADDPGPWAAPQPAAAPEAPPEAAPSAGEAPAKAAASGDSEGDSEENAPTAVGDGGPLVLTLDPVDAPVPAPEEAEPGAAEEVPPVLPALPDGPRRVFVIARQHGNEPAPTEAAMRFLGEYAATTDPARLELLRRVTFYVVPMMNADGAEAYQRRNARNVDLNRDWVNQSQTETRAVVRAVREVKPTLVVDLHELHPTDWTASFVEAMEAEAGAGEGVGDACNAAIAAVVGPLREQSIRIYARPVYNYREPRLSHRYFAVRRGIPSILVETRRAGDVPLETRTAVHYATLQAVTRYAAGESLRTPTRVVEAWLEGSSVRDHRLAQAKRAMSKQSAQARSARRNPQLASRGGSSAGVAKKREALRKKLAARKRAAAKRARARR